MDREYTVQRRREGKTFSTQKPLRTVLLAILFHTYWPRPLSRDELIKHLAPFYGTTPIPALYRDLETLTGQPVESLPAPDDPDLDQWGEEQRRLKRFAITYNRSTTSFRLARSFFTYHQLREVRGLLTNVINNGLVNLFTQEGKRAGIWPYLFFSDGVVYIQRKTLRFSISTGHIVETVQAQLRKTCGATIKSHAPGFKFSIQGLAKHPGYYFEFLSLEDYLDLLARFTIERTTNDITTIPFTKLRQMQANGEIAAELPLDFPADRRVGILSRFFSVVFATILGMLDKKQEQLRQQVEREMVNYLELEPYWTQALTIPNKGGVEYRWFWLAACYLRDHPGIREYEGRGNLYEVFSSTMRLLIELAGDELRKGMPQQYLHHLTRYLDSVVELPLSVRAGGALPDFAAELERYEGAKGRGHKLICTLCNSAYPAEEQTDNAVLFQPWVYKNKLSLHATKNAGGICAICSLELMLRQILQKGLLRLTGGKFEALKTKYLAVYPNFFYRVNLDTFADKGKPNWKYLGSIARDLDTDPLFLFSYLKKQQRGDSLYPGNVELYIHIFEKVLEGDLSVIQQCVDRYTVFYRGGYQSHSILKPVDIVAKAIIKSPLEIEKDDLLWQIQGELKNWLDRVRARQASGYAVFRGKDIDTREVPALHEFVRYFYEEVFERYCQGERGILRSRLNRFKDGCEACYVYKRSHQGFEEHEDTPEETPTV